MNKDIGKNIVSKIPKSQLDTKNIINVKPEIDRKVVTTETAKGFIKQPSVYVGKIIDKKIIIALTNANIFDDKSIPRKINELIKIKGVGEFTAKKILKILK